MRTKLLHAKIGGLACALSLFVLAGSAQALRPERQKVSETIDINSPPAQVWAVIGNFEDMSWHPLIAKTSAEGGNVVDKASRTLILKDNAHIDEALSRYDAKSMAYAYRTETPDTSVMPVTNFSSQLSVTSLEDGKSARVEWQGSFFRSDLSDNPPPEQSNEAAITSVARFYRLGLDALKARLERGH